MKQFWWQLRFAYTMGWKCCDLGFYWDSAKASFPDFGDEDPHECADTEMSYWET